MRDIHVIHKNDKYIVFHPQSLGLFSVAEDIGEKLKLYESRSGDSDFVVEDDILQLIDYFNNVGKTNLSKELKWLEHEPRTLCLFVSQDCNLRCSYCFADHGTFGRESRMMDIRTAKRSIDVILGKTFDNFIVFFGGEPFMNFNLMTEIVEYGRQAGLKINYTTVTNGTLMNDDINKFIKETLYSLCVSLDGPKEINDIQRYGSIESVHDTVIETIESIKSIDFPISIKCTATKKSIHALTAIARYFGDLGVTSMAFAHVSRIPQESEFYISDSDFEIYAKELSSILLENLNQLAAGDAGTEVAPNFGILRQLITRTRAIHHCSAGREYLAVTADGDVYPCHEFVGMDEFNMGNVHDEGFPGEDYDRIRAIFSNHSVYTSKGCMSCWARFLCGGDCAVRSYLYNGDLSSPTNKKCIWAKTIWETLLPEIAEIFQDKNKTNNLIKSLDAIKHNGMYKNLFAE
ncbi:MAG TPA: radical SAM protein [Methanotrichaceae archaeon]|nr:radical SAM protein [Methanotrichaceae archaeon]HQF17339.1 radical SAM protein [Methanotrichaceae archaeon]HQI91955.1 radical SAM protein [Methanotrichaceae archaeon]